ncbi:hypothetical protein FA13DRAFT_1711091 [Coprinellus micaceus]|uniref:Uncharacterized protein n=1 Tax=Coprinellus micaceus TaxID=71717 RepID=A0A4Y7T6A9_COPMI|nr:hypothetical protein FA13DRAFT_1711091 [Coprinellus micaceus]
MDHSSSQDWALPGMGPEALDTSSLGENKDSGAVADEDTCEEEEGQNERIAPVPSRATATIPKGVNLKESEKELLKATNVVAVIHGETIVVIDTKQPDPPQNTTSNIACSSPPSNTANASADESLDPADFITPSFLPPGQPFKKLLPVCISVVSIAHRYSTQQLHILAETQALVVLLMYIFQPSHVLNCWLFFRSAYCKKHKGEKGVETNVLDAAGEAWAKLAKDGKQGPWQAACKALKEDRQKVYAKHRYNSGQMKPVIHKALDLVEAMIQRAPEDGLSEDFTHDLQVAYTAAHRKLATKNKNAAAQKKRHEKNGKPSKRKIFAQGNGRGTAATAYTAGWSTNQDSLVSSNVAGTSQRPASEAVNAGTKRKRGTNPPISKRKTAKAEGVTQASRASASTSTAVTPRPEFCTDSSHKRFGNGIAQAAFTYTPLPALSAGPALVMAATPTNQGSPFPHVIHTPAPIHGLSGFGYAGQTFQGNRLHQNANDSDGSVSSNTPLSSIATPYSEFIPTPDLPTNLPPVRVAGNPLDHDSLAPVQACGEKGAVAENYGVSPMSTPNDWPLVPGLVAESSNTSQQLTTGQNHGEEDAPSLGANALSAQTPLIDYNAVYADGCFSDELGSLDLSQPFGGWDLNIPHGEGTQELFQNSANSYDSFNDYSKENYNIAQFGFN